MSQAKRRREAAIIDAAKERIVRAAARQAAGVQLRIRADVLREWRRGAGMVGVAHAIRQNLRTLTPLIQETMLAAHLAGELGAVRTADAAGVLTLARPIETAVDYFARRLGLSADKLAAITGRYGGAASSATDGAAVLLETKVIAALAENTAAGGHLRAGTEAIRRAFDAAGVTPANDYTIENIMRTQTAIAYSAGRQVRNADPDIDEILWGYEYNTVGDDRVRPAHAAMDGHRAPKDDPIWRTWTPPCGYGCRCVVYEIYKGDAEAVPSDRPGPVEVDGVTVTPGPDAGWDWNPKDLYAGLVAV